MWHWSIDSALSPVKTARVDARWRARSERGFRGVLRIRAIQMYIYTKLTYLHWSLLAVLLSGFRQNVDTRQSMHMQAYIVNKAI